MSVHRNAHVAVDERVILDPWKQANTDFLALSRVPEAMRICNEACAERGLLVLESSPRDVLSQHKVYAYIQQQIVALMRKNGILTCAGGDYVSLPPYFTKAPEQYFMVHRIKLLGWPDGLSKNKVSHWPVDQGFATAFLFINKRIDAVPLDLAKRIRVPDLAVETLHTYRKEETVEGRKKVKQKFQKLVQKEQKKYETTAIREARKFNKSMKSLGISAECPRSPGVPQSQQAVKQRREVECSRLEIKNSSSVRPTSSTTREVKPHNDLSRKSTTLKAKENKENQSRGTKAACGATSSKPETSEERVIRKAEENRVKEEAKRDYKQRRGELETSEQRAERRKLKALRKKAKEGETPEQRAKRRALKKEAKKIAKRKAKKAGVPYIPAAYLSRPALSINATN